MTNGYNILINAANKAIRECKRQRGIVVTGEELHNYKKELKRELDKYLENVKCADDTYEYDRYHLYVDLLGDKFYVVIDIINVEGIKIYTRVGGIDRDIHEAGRKAIKDMKERINETEIF